MKKIVLILISVGISHSCDNDDNPKADNELIGNWRLIESYEHTGIGIASWEPIESDKIITFEDNGIITSNGYLCDTSINSNFPTSGTYSASEFTFRSSDCTYPDFDYTFEQNENILIIDYFCVEACQMKYIKQ